MTSTLRRMLRGGRTYERVSNTDPGSSQDSCPTAALLVYDRLTASRRHLVRRCWPLAPGLEASVAADGTARVRRAETRASSMLFAGSPGTASVTTGRTELSRGSWSPLPDEVIPAPPGALGVNESGTVQIATVHAPASGAWPPPRLLIEEKGDTISLAVEGSGCGCHARPALAGKPCFRESHTEPL